VCVSRSFWSTRRVALSAASGPMNLAGRGAQGLLRCKFGGGGGSHTSVFQRCSWQQRQWVQRGPLPHRDPAPLCPSFSRAVHGCSGRGCSCGSTAHAPDSSSGSVAAPDCGSVVDPDSSSGSVAAPDCGSVVDPDSSSGSVAAPDSSSGSVAAPCCGVARAVCVHRRGPGRRAQCGVPTDPLPDCARAAPQRSPPPL
jgi:hypothetical protein